MVESVDNKTVLSHGLSLLAAGVACAAADCRVVLVQGLPDKRQTDVMSRGSFFESREAKLKETLSIINQMQQDGIIGKYAIGGAVGSTFYLEPSATADIDILVLLPTASGRSLLSLTPLYDYLKSCGCRAEAERIVVGDWPVQFLPPRNPLEHEALEQAVETEVEGIRTWVLRAEHLVAIALETGRAKDHARIVQYVEQQAVDENKLQSVLTRHGLVPKWERFERKFLRE